MIALPRRAASVLAALVLVVALLGACGGGGGDDATPTTAADSSSTTAPVGSALPGEGEGALADTGPFCTSIKGIQDLGAGSAATGAPDQVMAQNEAMLDLLDEATANVPDGAPADVESLFDDYQAIAKAIGAAAGDIDAAYAAIERDQPDVAARLFNASAHLPAFEYFANHCGIRFQ